MCVFIVDLKEEVLKHATPALYATMYQKSNNTCLYGVCHYCSPADPVCGTGNMLEGALILWLPRYLRLIKHRHPWQRTYKENKLATWEVDENYCDKVIVRNEIKWAFFRSFAKQNKLVLGERFQGLFATIIEQTLGLD